MHSKPSHISRHNLQVILLSAPINKLSVKHEEAEEQASLIMEVLDIEHRGYIEVFPFQPH